MSIAHALELNRRELREPVRSALVGTWVADEHGPTFAAFYPNALYQEGLAVNVTVGMAVRARWAGESLLGEDWARGSATAFKRIEARAVRRSPLKSEEGA